MKKSTLVALTLLASNAFAENLTIISGASATASTTVYAQTIASMVPGAKLLLAKDCTSAINTAKQMPNAVYLTSNFQIISAAKNNLEVSALMPVHLYGRMTDVESLKQFGVPIIEDCAHAIGARFKKKHVGTFGSAGCFSFYPTKNITTIEGGMVITDVALLEKQGGRSGHWVREASPA